MKILLLGLLLLSQAGPSAEAAKEGYGAHGGHAKEIDSKLYLFDFIDGGVRLNPYVNPDVTPNPVILKRLQRKFVHFKEVPIPIEIIARKLTEVALYDRLSALSLLAAIEMYHWALIDEPLIPLPIPNNQLESTPGKIYQLAIRSGRKIQVNVTGFLHLADDLHRAGLIFHEASYALVSLETLKIDSGEKACREVQVQDGKKARDLVGYLFSLAMREGEELFMPQVDEVIVSKEVRLFFPANPNLNLHQGAIISNPRLNLYAETISVLPGFLSNEGTVDIMPLDWKRIREKNRDLCKKYDSKPIKMRIEIEANAFYFFRHASFQGPNGIDFHLTTVKSLPNESRRAVFRTPEFHASECEIEMERAAQAYMETYLFL